MSPPLPIPGELAALLSLLDDEDPGTCAPILVRLERDRDLLDQAWRAGETRAAEGDGPAPPTLLVQACLRADAEALVDAYAAAEDLETGLWLLPRLNAPRTDHRATGEPELLALVAAVRTRLGDRPADGQTIARILAQDFAFAGNREHYDDPANSFLPEVLQRRCGLPILLTALWLLVCRPLGAMAEAIALPGHVVGRWRAADGTIGYLDLFAGGQDLDRDELDQRVQLAGERNAEPYLAAASDRALLKRMARNLAVSYLRRGDPLRATIAHAMATG